MARFVKGDVVAVPFPFTDLSQAKRRPALVLAELEGDDLILCQITTQTISDRYSITVNAHDFDSGRLRQSSNVRPNRIFTADSQIVLYRIGSLKRGKLAEVIDRVIEIIQM